MYRFHINLFADPIEASFDCTWEEAAARLERMPRMIFELDGSFVVSGDDERGCRWQIDGHLFDFDEHLYRVELHGTCTREALDELLSCVGWPEQPLTFEMVLEGITVDEQRFRSLAAKETMSNH